MSWARRKYVELTNGTEWSVLGDGPGSPVAVIIEAARPAEMAPLTSVADMIALTRAARLLVHHAAALVRGVRANGPAGTARDLIRSPADDLFRVTRTKR